VFIFSVKRVAQIRKRPPMPPGTNSSAPEIRRSRALGRWTVAASGAVVGAFLFILSLGPSAALPERGSEVQNPVGSSSSDSPSSDFASAAEMSRNWPRFRGWEGSGLSVFTNAPESWDTKTGAGILWQAPVPARGFNSPIAWGDRFFFSGGDATKREVFCLDGRTGQTIWQKPVVN